MKLLVDMNISPTLCDQLRQNGYEAIHWSKIGDPKARDSEILRYAAENDFVVVTHDLDFGAILAVTAAGFPSVIQIRMQDVLSTEFITTLLKALKEFQDVLISGALIVIDHRRAKARVLPLRSK